MLPTRLLQYLVVTNLTQSESVKNIFDPVVDSVVELVKDQFRAVKHTGGNVKVWAYVASICSIPVY